MSDANNSPPPGERPAAANPAGSGGAAKPAPTAGSTSGPTPGLTPGLTLGAAAGARADQAPRGGVGVVGAFIIALIAGGALLAGAYVTRDAWLGQTSPASDAKIDQAVADNAALRKQLADLTARLPKPGDAKPAEISAADIKALQDALKALVKEKEALSDWVTQLAAKIETTGGAGDGAQNQRIDRLDSQLRALTGRLADLDRKSAQLDQALDQVQKIGERAGQYGTRIEQIERDAAGRSGQDARSVDSAKAAGLIALAFRLRQAVDAGAPYAAQLGALKPLLGEDAEANEALKALEPGAAAGLPTRAALRVEFARMARTAVAVDDEDGDMFSEAWRRIRQIVSVRRIGADVKGEDAEAVIARAEAALGQGHLAETLAQLRALKGRPAQAAAGWIAKAQALFNAEQACDKLLSLGAQRLARAGDKT